MKVKYLLIFVVLLMFFVSATDYEGYVLSSQRTTNPALQEAITYFQETNNIPIKTSASLQDKVVVISVADSNELARSNFGVWRYQEGYWEVKTVGDDIFIMGTTEADVVNALQSLNERNAPSDYSGVIFLVVLLLLVGIGVYFFIKYDVFEKIVNKMKFSRKQETPLQKYVRMMRRKGFSDDRIKKTLLNAGWKKEDLEF